MPLFFLFMLISVFSCKNDDDDNMEKANLIGKWQPYKLSQSATLSTGPFNNTTDLNECQQRSRILFNSDNSGRSTLYSEENGTCSLQADSNFTYTFNPDNNDLTVKSPDGSTHSGTVESISSTNLVYKLVGEYDFEGEDNVRVTTIISARKTTN